MLVYLEEGKKKQRRARRNDSWKEAKGEGREEGIFSTQDTAFRFSFVRLRHKLRELMTDAMARDDNDSQQYRG